MSNEQEAPLDFEKALAELETLVERMEEGELSLEEAVRTYERGVALGRSCNKALDAAEQRILLLSERDGAESLEPFDPDAGTGSAE